MGQAFDPYYNWLGIPEADQPPNYYRLLGLAPLEANPTVIEHAADRVMIHLRTFAAGPHGKDSQRLLNEVATARVCLLDAVRKGRYDADLQARLGLAPTASATRMPPMPRAVGVANLPKAAALPTMQSPESRGVPVAAIAEAPVIAVNRAAPAVGGAAAAPRKVAPGRKPDEIVNPQAAAIINVVKITMGGLGGLSMAILLVWVVFRVDALGLFSGDEKPQVAQNPQNPATKAGPNTLPVDPVDPKAPVKTPSQPSKVPSTPTEPTDPGNPFQPVIDPTEPTDPRAPPSTPKRPTKKKKKSAAAPTDPAVPMTNPVTPPVDPPQPVEPPKPALPMPPPPTTAAAPADARNAMPSAEERKGKLAELEAFYSKEFEDSKRPAGREKFPEFLLKTADTIKADPVARFVLMDQAYKRLLVTKDFSLAVEVVDRFEQEYVVDPFALRVHTLVQASKDDRQSPAQKQAIVQCAVELAELAMSRQRMSDSLTLANLADNLARALKSQPLRTKTLPLKEEVEKAQAEWGPVERARQTLATTPNDPAAALVVGRNRCLVAGDWTGGLPILALAGEDPLAIAARRDLAGPSENQSAAAIADAWFELGKGDEKLKPCYARALHWYRRALANSTGAEQVPWLQRVELIEGLKLPERYFATTSSVATNEPLPTFVSMYFRNVSFEPINCFNFVNQLELKASPWNAYSSTSPSIYSKPDIVYGRVPSHVPNIPREYQLGVRVGQYYSSGQGGPMMIGLVGPKGQFAAVIDMPIGTEYCTFLTLADAKTPEQNPTLARYTRQHLMFGDESVLVQVRRNRVTVQINNRVVSQYEGDLSKLTLPREWAIANPKSLMLGAHQGSYRVSSWILEPVAPAPRLSQSANPPAVPGLPGFPGPPGP
jgi:hypothetical protein